MNLVLALIIALASAADSRPVSPRTPRAIGYDTWGETPSDIIKYVPMTNAEYAEFYHAEIERILDSMRKRK